MASISNGATVKEGMSRYILFMAYFNRIKLLVSSVMRLYRDALLVRYPKNRAKVSKCLILLGCQRKISLSNAIIATME